QGKLKPGLARGQTRGIFRKTKGTKEVTMQERPQARVGEFLEYLSPGLLNNGRCPPWPPDVFALAASVLRRSGAYVRVLDLPPRDNMDLLGKQWSRKASEVAWEWRRSLNQSLSQKGSSKLDDLSD